MDTLFAKVGSTLTLSQRVEKRIEEVIRQKKILPGEKLPTEKELCEMFAVSRTALREALRMLSGRGLITIRKGSGIYVNDYSAANAIKPMSLFLELNFDKDLISHVIHVRQMLEPQIARMAASHRTEEDLRALNHNLKKFVECRIDDYRREGELDREFHLLLAKASGNPIIPVMAEPIFRLMPKIRTLVYAHVDHAKSAALEFHQKLVEAIRDKDEDRAEQAMIRHLGLAEEHSRKVLEVIE